MALLLTARHGTWPSLMLLDMLMMAPDVVIAPASEPLCGPHGDETPPPIRNSPAKDESDCDVIVHSSKHTLLLVEPSSKRASTARVPLHVPTISG